MKYPLLLKQVVKYSDDTDDIRLLQAAISYLEQVNIYPVPKKISICKKFTEFAGYRYQVGTRLTGYPAKLDTGIPGYFLYLQQTIFG